MGLQAIRHHLARSLRARVLVLVLIGFAAVSAPAYLAFTGIVDATILRLGTLFAEKQILYDRYRGLETLMSELTLAETLAGTQAVRDWVRNEADPAARARGLAELEHFRHSFADRSYFLVIDGSGNYYFNDAADSYADDQYRYTLNPDDPEDSWYYATRALGAGCHLNVNNDANLRVTKVWINCVIREDGRVLGLLGTGIDLTAFIREVVDVPQTGVNAIFVDRSGAIQAHRDPALVDYHSLTKDLADKTTIFSMLAREADRTRLAALMEEVRAGETLVRSAFMEIEGEAALVGVGYLDRLDWFNVTVMEIDQIIDRGLFGPIAGLVALMMVGISGVLVLIFKRSVLDRLARLESAVRAAEMGDFSRAAALDVPGSDEIGRLGGAFAAMADRVGETTRALETRVRERTETLERLAFMDALTGISNRRGFIEAFAARPETPCGLLIVDIDHFKQINDTHGHAAGDAVIVETARRIGRALGPDEFSARWGGDEFLILVTESAPHLLRAKAFRTLAALTGDPFPVGPGRGHFVTFSLGGCLVEPGDSIDLACELADSALYMAKSEGRNRAVVLDRASRPRPARVG